MKYSDSQGFAVAGGKSLRFVIGHLKADGLLERNHLHGERGDAINLVLAAAGHNLRLLLA